MARDVVGTKLFFGKARRNLRNFAKYGQIMIAQDEREFTHSLSADSFKSPQMAFDTMGTNLKDQLVALVARANEALAATVQGAGRPTFA